MVRTVMYESYDSYRNIISFLETNGSLRKRVQSPLRDSDVTQIINYIDSPFY